MNSRRILPLLRALQDELETAIKESDAFALHVYRARRLYRQHPPVFTKGERGHERHAYVVESTYQEAKLLGYCGTRESWVSILSAERSTPRR